MTRCYRCSREFETKAQLDRAWREVVGFAEPRKQGGTNALAGRRLTGRYACPGCIHLIKLGEHGSHRQMGLGDG